MKDTYTRTLSRLWQLRVRHTDTEGIESGEALVRWLGLGMVIGLVAGLGAITFTWAIDSTTHLLLILGAGYTPPAAAGEGTAHITAAARPWLFPVLLGLGGLVSGAIVFRFAPEAEGHGTDAAIDAFHHKGGRVRARVPLVKLISAAITIGSGGSGGREGPTAQIASGFGSLLATFLKLDTQNRRIAMAAGMGAGIGAIFRAPLGGALMGAEILYLSDLEVEAILPSLVASIVGYSVYSAVYGWTPVFGNLSGLTFDNPVQLVYYAALGVICGGFGLLYAKSFLSTSHFFHHLRIPNWVKPGIGGVLVGLMGLVSPGFLHMGYGWVQATMSNDSFTGLLSLPLWLVLLLPLGKIVATSLSIGSGGSGGIFGPGMVVGGFVGAAFWRLTESWLPGMPLTPAPFVIIGMMAMFGGIAHAPLAVMLMVAEMTGNLNLLAPAMVAVAISLLICGKRTIYVNQVPTRADSPAHRYRYSFPLLASLPLADVLNTRVPTVPNTLFLDEAEKRMVGQPTSGLPVTDAHGLVVGVVTRADIAAVAPAGYATTTVATIMRRDPVTADMGQGLHEVLEMLATHHVSWVPVVRDCTADRHLVGVVDAADIVKAYRAALTFSTRRLGSMVSGTSVVESTITAQSPLVNHTLREIHFPEDAVVITVRRHGEVIFPHGDTCLLPGDVVTLLVSPGTEAGIEKLLTVTQVFMSADGSRDGLVATLDIPEA